MYFKLKNAGQIEKRTIDILRTDDEVERHVVLVARCKYNSDAGLSDKLEEIEDNPYL